MHTQKKIWIVRLVAYLLCTGFVLHSAAQNQPPPPPPPGMHPPPPGMEPPPPPHHINRRNLGVNDTIVVQACIEDNGDTIPCSWLEDEYVFNKMTNAQKRRYVEWTRLRNAVYVTYPYAIRASKVMNEINAQLVNVTDKKKRKEIILSREKELKKEFADKLTQLSVYQGKVLMKLIYRQTGNNCYEIIESYKGKFNAGFWQTVAVIFGSNLRQNYDPGGPDRDMEMIVQDVERMYGYRKG